MQVVASSICIFPPHFCNHSEDPRLRSSEGRGCGGGGGTSATSQRSLDCPCLRSLWERGLIYTALRAADCSLGPEVLFDKLSSFRPDLAPPQTLGPTLIHNKRERPSFCMTKVATLPLLEQSAYCKSFLIHICTLLWAVANCPITVFPQLNSGGCWESTSRRLGKPGVWRLTLCFSVCFLHCPAPIWTGS